MSSDTQEPPAPSPAPPGRRERKKAELRRSISDVATRMFVERGFDAVTLAEVAEAADVSIKTIFNHFGSKEDLFLDRETEVRDAILGSIRDRAPGLGIADALADLLADQSIPGEGWEVVREPVRRGMLRRFLSTWQSSESLQGRHLLWNERLLDALCALLAEELGPSPADDRVKVMGALLVSAIHLRQRTFAAAILAGAPADEVERRVRAITAEALGRAVTAFPELRRRRRAAPTGGPAAADGQGR